jgi:hypothetical protein
MRVKIAFKVLEIILSTAFLVLCTKAFCSHFYRDLKRPLQNRRQQVAFIRTSPSLVPAKHAHSEVLIYRHLGIATARLFGKWSVP